MEPSAQLSAQRAQVNSCGRACPFLPLALVMKMGILVDPRCTAQIDFANLVLCDVMFQWVGAPTTAPLSAKAVPTVASASPPRAPLSPLGARGANSQRAQVSVLADQPSSLSPAIFWCPPRDLAPSTPLPPRLRSNHPVGS
jgi:hypothetical protein